MTPPSTILTSERDRSSMVAWGTLCALAAVQTVIGLKLLSSSDAPNTPAAAAQVAGQPLPKAVPGVVPEVGQIALPPTAGARPPLPGSLIPAPAAPVSSGPPPIGSFSRPLAPVQAAPVPSSLQPPPAVPAVAAMAPAVAAPPAVPARQPAPAAPVVAQTPSRPKTSATVPTRQPAPAPVSPPPPAPAMAAGVPPGFPASAPPIKSASAQSTVPADAPGAKPDANAALLRDVNFVISSAKEIRGMSDMQGALELLRRADEMNPDHPAIIAEVAQTYEQMGITAKATDAWRRIQLLGPTKAGSYFELAARRLGSGSAAVAPPAQPGPGGMPAPESEKFLRLGACQAVRDFNVSSGERYVLRVPIVRAGNRPINSQEMNLEVFFFDRVNNEKVALTIAPEPVEAWQSAPVDWQGTGEEVLDVVYHLPALSAAEIQQHGRRTYYGYMLRLYYNNKLQDVASEPRDLLEFGTTPGGAPGGANPLLPQMSK